MQLKTNQNANPKQHQLLRADPPAAIMRGLHRAGYNILPVGTDRDQKAAAIKFTGRRLCYQQAVAICHRNGSGAYGVRLDDNVVVDFDDDQSDQRDFVRRRFGSPVVEVGTGRGYHWYYRTTSGFDATGARELLRGAGVRADVKFGSKQYVIGPESQRLDGVTYFPVLGDLATDRLSGIGSAKRDLPSFTEPKVKALIAKGKRHESLKSFAYLTVWGCQSLVEFSDKVQNYAQCNFEDPETVSLGEVLSLVNWFWHRYESGRLSPPSDPSFPISRLSYQAIGKHDDALALYCRLIASHGGLDRDFCLKREAMVAADCTMLSRRRFLAARNYLLQSGLLETARKEVVGVRGRTYRLSKRSKG